MILELVGLPVVRQWHATHLCDKQLSPATTLFCDFLLERGAALIERAVGTPASLQRARKSRTRRTRAAG